MPREVFRPPLWTSHPFSSGLFVVLVSVFGMLLSFQSAWTDRVSSSSVVLACLDLKGMTEPNETVMTYSYPYVNFLSERNAVNYPPSPEQVPEIISKYSIRYVLLNRLEDGLYLYEYARTYFDENPGFRKIKTYEEWGNPEATVIYEVAI